MAHGNRTWDGGGVKEKVQEKGQGVAAAVGDFASEAKETVENLASSAGEGVMHAKEAVQAWASDAAGKAGEALKGAGDEITTLIRRYPVPALLVGLGLGFLLSRTLRR